MGVGPSGGSFCAFPHMTVPEDPDVREELRNFMYFLGPLKEGESEEIYGVRFGKLAGAKEEENWSVTREVFLKILTQKGYEGPAPEAVWNFLDQQKQNKLNAESFKALAVAERVIGRAKPRLLRLETPKMIESLEARARRRLWVFKVFVREKFGGSAAQLWGAMGKERTETLSLKEFERWMKELGFPGDIEATFLLLDEDCWGKVSQANVSGMMRAASKDGSEKGSQRGLTKDSCIPEPFLSERSKSSSGEGGESKRSREKSSKRSGKEQNPRMGKENAPPSNNAAEKKEKRRASKEGSGGLVKQNRME